MLSTVLGAFLMTACDKPAEVAGSAPRSENGPSAPAGQTPESSDAPNRVEACKTLMRQMLGSLETMTTAFEGVKDEASAKAASEVIASTTNELIAFANQARALKDQLTEAENKAMEEDQAGPEIESKMESIRERLTKAGAALPQDPAVQQAIMPAIKSFGEAMRAMAVESGYKPSEPAAAPEEE